MLDQFSSKALPLGFVLQLGEMPYRIDKCLHADGFGFTYSGSALRNGQPVKEVVIREFFMSRCCYRGDDGAEMMCSEDIEATVNDTLTRHARNLLIRKKIVEKVDSLIDIIDVFEENGTYYHIGESLKGDSLKDVVTKNGPLPSEKARAIILPIFEAVKVLHTANILHTDICPENIRFRNGKPVLIHLYAAKHFFENGEVAISFPSISCRDGYAPPEQYGTIENFQPQSDIYSLAATIIFCLTGKQLPTSLTLDENQVNDFLPKSMSKHIRAALVHATLHDINNRTQTITSFRKELDMYFQQTLNAQRQAEEMAKNTFKNKLIRQLNRVREFFKRKFRKEVEETEQEEEVPQNIEEIEASMNEAYPRLIVIGGLTIFVIIALLVTIFVIL